MNEYYSFTVPEKTIAINSLVSLIDAEYSSDFYFGGESHDFWEAVCVRGGTVGITADDRVYTLTAGDMIFHKPMEFHKIYSCNGKPILVYIFSFSAFGPGMREYENRTLRLSESDFDTVESIINAGKSAFDISGGMIRGTKDERFAQIYINMLENLLLSLPASDGVSALSDPDSLVFAEIVRVLEENLFGGITLDFVAHQCCISVSKLKKLFKKYTGIGVIAYYNKAKIKKSLELLHGGSSVRDTAEALSFSCPFYFSSVFKKEMGISPSEYKKQIKTNK